jgi:hypothetical protein
MIFTNRYPAAYLIQKEDVLEQGLNFLSKPASLTGDLKKVRDLLD